MKTRSNTLMRAFAVVAAATLVSSAVLAGQGPGGHIGRHNAGQSSRGNAPAQAPSSSSSPRASSNTRASSNSSFTRGGSPRSEGRGANRGNYVTGGNNGTRYNGPRDSGPRYRTNPDRGFRPNPTPGFSTSPTPGFSTRPTPGFSTSPPPGFNQYPNYGRPRLSTQPSYNHRPGYSNGHRGARHEFNKGRDYRGFRHRHWHGGYWHGHFWPRVYYRPNYVAFWSVLPPAYSTFWFGGRSYYYVNDVYYTYSPDRYGYVATDPPPAVESAPDEAPSESTANGAANLYVYPRNGQSEEQTANDRFECHQWAVSQTGFDPTGAAVEAPAGGTASTASVEDYRRAIIACLDGRGYSAN